MYQLNVAKKILESKNIQNVAVTSPSGNYIVLDFGKESRGGIRIITSHINSPTNTALVRFRFGESLAEAYSDIGYKGATNHHAPRDFTVVVSGIADMTFGDMGYRHSLCHGWSAGVIKFIEEFC